MVRAVESRTGGLRRGVETAALLACLVLCGGCAVVESLGTGTLTTGDDGYDDIIFGEDRSRTIWIKYKTRW